MIKKIGIGVAIFFAFIVILVIVVPSSDKKEEVQTEQSLPSVSPVVSNKAVVAVKATQKPQVLGEYLVTKVVDGDTVGLNINGKVETVRLIGMNTPETVDPRKPVECFGKEASNRAKELLTGKSVKIESDPNGDTRDKYDRLLLYIFLGDGTNYAKKMIMDGYAYEYTYNVKYKYQAEFKQAQKYAEDNKLGLWAPGVCQSTAPAPTQTQATTPTQTPASGGQTYTCSSNTYNCTDFTTHAEAQHVFELCGGVNNDIHELDRDSDGEACETLP
ncbi:MAG: thermonuclease family protein [bacterium]|nr:thermonuclease family protein [bacterium]